MSVTFNGTSTGLELDANIFGASTYPIAFFCWFLPRGTSLSGNSAIFGSGRFGGGSELVLLNVGSTTLRAQAQHNSGSSIRAERAKTLSDTWFCAMAVYTSATSRTLHVIGEAAATNAESVNPFAGGNFDKLRIGIRPHTNELYFQGDIAECAVWQGTAPDATDFAALAGGALPETIKSGSLIWHRELLAHTDLDAGAAGSSPAAIGTLSTGATHPITRSGDTTAPTLTSPSGTGGLGVCSGSVSTNEAGGTLFAVATASTTQPSIAQIKAGQDHTGAAALRAVSQAVTATGTQTIASGAISGGAGTRYWHFVHTDAAGNDSARVSSAGFEVTATATQLVLSVPDAAGLSGFNGIVLSAAAPGASVTVIATPTGISFNGSGQATINVTGLGIPVGARRWVSVTNSTGDPAQSPAPVQAQGPVTAS